MRYSQTQHRRPPADQQKKVDEEYQKGEADLRLRLERDGWLISSASSDRLADMEREMRFLPEPEDEASWEEHVDRGWAAIRPKFARQKSATY